MKRKATVGIIAIIILICSIVIFRSIYIQRSYYPMGGEVTILAKQADNYGYYITVEQGKPDDAGWGQFELKCTQEQYEAVDVGDVVKCDREQSIVTNSGTVHKIQKRYLLYLKIGCFLMPVWVLYGFLIEPIPQDLIPYLQPS